MRHTSKMMVFLKNKGEKSHTVNQSIDKYGMTRTTVYSKCTLERSLLSKRLHFTCVENVINDSRIATDFYYELHLQLSQPIELRDLWDLTQGVVVSPQMPVLFTCLRYHRAKLSIDNPFAFATQSRRWKLTHHVEFHGMTFI